MVRLIRMRQWCREKGVNHMTLSLGAILAQSYPAIPVGKTDQRVSVAWDKMTNETIAALAWHGLKQKGGDTNAGAGKAGTSVKDMVANVAQVVAKAETNTLGVRERETDPVAKELTELVNKSAAKHFRGKKPTPDEFKAWKALAREDAKLIALAQRRADEMAALEVDIDV